MAILAVAAMAFGTAFFLVSVRALSTQDTRISTRRGLPKLSDALEILRTSEHLDDRLTAQVATFKQILEAIEVLRHPRNGFERDQAARILRDLKLELSK